MIDAIIPRSPDLIGTVLSETKEGSRQLLDLETAGILRSAQNDMLEGATGCLNSLHGKECCGRCAMRCQIMFHVAS